MRICYGTETTRAEQGPVLTTDIAQVSLLSPGSQLAFLPESPLNTKNTNTNHTTTNTDANARTATC